MLKGKKCPRVGVRVKADPNPASMAMYSPGHGPTPGATGVTTTVPLPGGRKTCLPGPGGGLVYVKWDDGRTFGVSRYDLSKTKGSAVVMQAAPAVYGLGHDPLHNEQVLQDYGKCLRKCKKKQKSAIGECIDKCLGVHARDVDLRYPPFVRPGPVAVDGVFAGIGTIRRKGRGTGDKFFDDHFEFIRVDDSTEADEGAKDKAIALADLRQKLLEYARGLETLGVLTMYENAARRAGATSEEIQEQRAMVQRILHGD